MSATTLKTIGIVALVIFSLIGIASMTNRSNSETIDRRLQRELPHLSYSQRNEITFVMNWFSRSGRIRVYGEIHRRLGLQSSDMQVINRMTPAGFNLFVWFIRWAGIGIIIFVVTFIKANAKEVSSFSSYTLRDYDDAVNREMVKEVKKRLGL